MRSILRLAGSRLLPALLTALGVVLITGGLLSYAVPNTVGPLGSAGASPTDPAKRPGRAVASRVVIPALNVDLPVVKGNDGYPLCNVAMYLHTANTAARDAFGQPGEGRATYLYR